MSKSKRILYLTLKRRWFDLIASGEKTIEYRTISPFYSSRLEAKDYDEIFFRNGRDNRALFMRVEYKGYSIIEKDQTSVYALKLGKIIEIDSRYMAQGSFFDDK